MDKILDRLIDTNKLHRYELTELEKKNSSGYFIHLFTIKLGNIKTKIIKHFIVRTQKQYDAPRHMYKQHTFAPQLTHTVIILLAVVHVSCQPEKPTDLGQGRVKSTIKM